MSFDKELEVVGSFPTTKGSVKNFLDAVTVWINKPHCVNKRLCGTKLLQVTAADNKTQVTQIISNFQLETTKDDVENSQHEEAIEVDLKENTENFVVIFRENLPKQLKIFPSLIEAVVFDAAAQSITFCPLKYVGRHTDSNAHSSSDTSHVDNEVVYCFSYVQHSPTNSLVQLSCSRTSSETVPPSSHVQLTTRWLTQTLAPKVKNWTEVSNLTTSVTSLRLVGVERYSTLYNTLKHKYGLQLVKNWTETTDPQKFVYEDIGIATYLLLIWAEDRERLGTDKKQSFVDLGCGNGLLVYILSCEGHRGLGIDLRKRSIWDTFGQDAMLEEKSITPSAENLFPDYDWIIGNHSDELTPWIPVIAARSSSTCSYFVLPCCHHDFNRRFSGKVKGESSYRSYLTYVSQVGEVCGFQVEEDTLRIPSTKRVCHIGRRRTYSLDQEEAVDKKRQAFIDQRCRANMGPVNTTSNTDSNSMGPVNTTSDTGPVNTTLDTDSASMGPVNTTSDTDNSRPSHAERCALVSDLKERRLEKPSVKRSLSGESANCRVHGGQCKKSCVGQGITDTHVRDSMEGVTDTLEGVTDTHVRDSMEGVTDTPEGVTDTSDSNTVDNLANRETTVIGDTLEDGEENLDLQSISSVISSERGNRGNKPTDHTTDKSKTETREDNKEKISADVNEGNKETETREDNKEKTSAGVVNLGNKGTNPVSWADNFQARSSMEAVRNCQKVSRETKECVVRKVFEAVMTADDATTVTGHQGRSWRKGGSVELCKVADMLDGATREQLKSECGGVQTLLRNHNHIFQESGGKVMLRDFSVSNPWSQYKGGKKRKPANNAAAHHKTSLCWFDANHPDGCPRSAENCSFAHGVQELKPTDELMKKRGKR